MNFLRRVSKADRYDIPCRTIAKCLMEISLLDHRFLPYRPSLVAASSMALSRIILERGKWDQTFSYYSGYNENAIEPVITLTTTFPALRSTRHSSRNMLAKSSSRHLSWHTTLPSNTQSPQGPRETRRPSKEQQHTGISLWNWPNRVVPMFSAHKLNWTFLILFI